MIKSERKKKFFLNTVTSIIFQILSVLIGFILPKLFIKYYGSEINGLVSSITQFLGFIALMELGIGAVVQSVLYKPLVLKDNIQISKIVRSSQTFFNRIVMFFLIYIVALSVVYPKINSDFDWYYSVGLIIIIAISSIAQYFFGINNQLLLMADQRNYISNIITILTLVLNTIVSIVFITKGYGIHTVKLVSTSVLVLKPILLKVYVDRHYKLIKNIKYDEEPITQKWNGIAQHLASFILNNTDIVILTIFSNLINVSIYAVYKMVTNGVQQIIVSLTSGIQALFGHMLANNEINNLSKAFSRFEWIVHTLVTLLFSCTAILIVPFITVYTKGITDANYVQPLFSLILTISVAMYCIRLPYNIMVLAAGHYKQTQSSAIIEMLLNIVISVLLVKQFGLVGIAVGTLIAVTYRTFYLAKYLSNIIIKYKFKEFLKNYFVDCLTFVIIIKITNLFDIINTTSYLTWFLSAAQVLLTSLLIVIGINLIFYKKNFKQEINSFVNRRK